MVLAMQPETFGFYADARVHISHTSPRKPARWGQAQGAIVSEMPRKQEVVYAVTLAQQGFALVYNVCLSQNCLRTTALDVDLDIHSAAL